MTSLWRWNLLFTSFALVLPAVVLADDKIEFPNVSQHATVKQRVGLTDVEVEYSRPNKNNREIFGGLVPFEKVWRTGANEPTRIKFSEAVKLGEKEVPAGEYALYTIPKPNEWTVIVSKETKSPYKPEADLVRVTVKPVEVNAAVETFTIGFADLKTDSATLVLEWDKTRVPVRLTTNTIEKVLQGIEMAVKSGKEQDASFYYNAASFYFEQNKDLPQALKWADQASEKNPDGYFIFYKKAQIEAKLGNKKEAIAAADKSNEILNARPEPRDETALRNNRLLIESLR